MTLQAIAGSPSIILPPVYAGMMQQPQFFSSVLLDATKEAFIQYGYVITSDGGSHTIDTTGSSSLGFKTGTVSATWNASTVLKVGLADMDTGTGPPARAVNVSDVITMGVSKSYTGGTAPTTASWVDVAPDAGTKTIANGALVAFCVQMTTQGGTDACNVNSIDTFLTPPFIIPGSTSFVGAAYANVARLPNAVITFSDGAFGYFYGGHVLTASTTQTWNNASGTKEYGNILQVPFPTKAYGIVTGMNIAGDCDLILYSDPLGTPVAEKTVSVDLNTIAVSGDACLFGAFLFTSPFSLAANTNYAAIAKPSSATNVKMNYLSVNTASHLNSFPLGTNCYAINRNTGAFAAQNSSKDRFTIGLMVGAFDDAAGGGGGGLLVNPGMRGGMI